ncbi:signal peptidase I [Flavobacterium filum]|uniref:signal peptidase I n=1 Tax=Flavobacterium filum TaxID=370974 RepID=UPI000406047D|nr:signal peptidase I [Flavobacterium filum]
MKKIFKFSLITAVVLYSIYFILNITGVLSIYNNSTVANEPNLKMNSKILISNLINPINGDFVSFKFEDAKFGKAVRIFRLCGKENDIIEIKNGVVFINNENRDKDVNFIHNYFLTSNNYQNLALNEKQHYISISQFINNDSLIVSIDDNFANKKGFGHKRVTEKDTDKNIKSIFKHDWNKDNFGPIKVPEGKVFLLGDNRDNSEDSRYLGFINFSDIIGTVLFNN